MICLIAMQRKMEEKNISKLSGFKPDFWVALADAITVEGVILDMANHQVIIDLPIFEINFLN